MYSEENESRVAREIALRVEREERGLSLRDTRDRVTKYDRLVKNTKTKVGSTNSMYHYYFIYGHYTEC